MTIPMILLFLDYLGKFERFSSIVELRLKRSRGTHHFKIDKSRLLLDRMIVSRLRDEFSLFLLFSFVRLFVCFFLNEGTTLRISQMKNISLHVDNRGRPLKHARSPARS